MVRDEGAFIVELVKFNNKAQNLKNPYETFAAIRLLKMYQRTIKTKPHFNKKLTIQE